MKLNLGSNNTRYQGFLNVDIRNITGVDIVEDVTVLASIPDGAVDEIIAHNILEHIAPDRTAQVLSLWFKKLKLGGWIQIGVPDGELIFSRHLNGRVTRRAYKTRPWGNVIHSIFGNMGILRKMHGDDAERYMHHTLFCESFLRRSMESAGFGDIIRVRPNHRDNVTLRGWKRTVVAL